jgi:predicted phage terminase large subunit-like protein
VSNDYFACVVIGIDQETGLIFVLDAWHDKLTFLARANAIERTNRLWMPHMLGIEQSSLKSLSQYLTEATMTRFVPLRPHLSKMIRLSEVTPWLERGQVLFNPALNPENIVDAEGHGDVISELCEFPLASNDDLVDAFVHAVNLGCAFAGIEEARTIDLGIYSLDDDGDGDKDSGNEIKELFAIKTI